MNLAASFAELQPKDKAPHSARVLNTWIAMAERQLASDGGRLGWLVASTVATAALQQTVDAGGTPLFLLKGGTLLQHVLPQLSRATTDLDGLVRCDIDEFIVSLDRVLAQAWGPLALRRGPLEEILVPHRQVRPRRFDITLQLKGITWRRIQVEISPDEGNAGAYVEEIAPPSLIGFGLPTPDRLVGLSMRYQIAQKVHASTDPHDPPTDHNDRARDAVDLLLLRDLATATGHPTPSEIRGAIEDIFNTRALEAMATAGEPRTWPARLEAHPHWAVAYEYAAKSANIDKPLNDTISEVNAWLDQIERSQ